MSINSPLCSLHKLHLFSQHLIFLSWAKNFATQVKNKQMVYNLEKKINLIYSVTSLAKFLHEGCVDKIQDGVRQKTVSQQLLFRQLGFIQRVIWKCHFSRPKAHPKTAQNTPGAFLRQTLPEHTGTRNCCTIIQAVGPPPSKKLSKKARASFSCQANSVTKAKLKCLYQFC